MFETLRPTHPRLLWLEQDTPAIRRAVGADPLTARVAVHVVERAEALLETEPVERKLDGHRLLLVSRTVLDRILNLATAWRLLGVAEMTTTVALGYDWLHGVLPAPPLPLHWHGDGPIPVAFHRSSWDPDATFVAIKAGRALHIDCSTPLDATFSIHECDEEGLPGRSPLPGYRQLTLDARPGYSGSLDLRVVLAPG